MLLRMLLRLSMLLGGLGFLPALLLGGTIFFLAFVALVLSVHIRGDSQKQRQEGSAGDSSYSHKCSLRYPVVMVCCASSLWTRADPDAKCPVSRGTLVHRYKLMLRVTLTPGYEALHR